MVDEKLCLAWLLAKAETFTNTILSHHTQSSPLFLGLEGKCLKVVLTDMQVEFEIIFHASSILIQEAKTPAQVVVHGTCMQWINLLESRSPENLHIEGDLKTAQNLQKLFQTLSIDVEALCCDLWGEWIGKNIYRSAKTVNHGLRSLLHNILLDSSAFALHETPMAIDVQSVQTFAQSAYALRRQLEQLEARYEALRTQYLAKHREVNDAC